MTNDCVQRFLLDALDIRGVVVRLGPVWQKMLAGRHYPEPVAELLGEMSATTLLLGCNLKQTGRLTVQMRGNGPVSLLVIDCNEQLHIRGMARSSADLAPGTTPELLGNGQLLISLDMPSMREPYQSLVPLDGNTIAEIFEHYLKQSEQRPSRLFLAASADAAAGLFLQKLPEADQHDQDGWQRITQLAATVKPAELLELDTESLLTRLFHEDMAAHGIRLYDPRPVAYHCPEDRNKVADMIRSLGRADAETILAEHGEIVIRDDICNRDYRFSPDDVATLFAGSEGKALH